MTAPAALADVAAAVAREAGELLRRGWGSARLAATKTSPTDAVTEIDRASERLILAALHKVRPDDGVLGEEGASIDGTSGIRWVVDPLDGTVNYLYAHPSGWAVSVAAEDSSGVLAGAVYDPARDEMFLASRGGGATRNGEPVTVSAATDLGQALVGTGFGYRSDVRAAQAEVLRTVLPLVRDLRRGGSAAIELCWVACGRLDAFYERGLGPWDWAAGSLVVTEAGGRFSRDESGLVVAGPEPLFGALSALVAGR